MVVFIIELAQHILFMIILFQECKCIAIDGAAYAAPDEASNVQLQSSKTCDYCKK